MKITGVICEYNPLHLGHKKQIDAIRRLQGPDTAVVCLMSGNFVQRGYPAVFPKMARAEAALRCGADLVLELPVTYALSSAEGFAAGGVRVLSAFCDNLCFGAEDADPAALFSLARALLTPEFSQALRAQLDAGLSFPAARQRALQAMGLDAAALEKPNNILAVEYCKSILSQGSSTDILPIHRPGSYHALAPDASNPSATSLRCLAESGQDIAPFLPAEAATILASSPLFTLSAGERAMLARLRTMTDAEFEALPYGSEGLWRKFMHACRQEADLESILTAAKSKRYTRSRLDRMAMCAFLGITQDDLNIPAPYTRVLAMNDRGRKVLKLAKGHTRILNAGDQPQDAYYILEKRCSDLYGLFRTESPQAPGQEERLRIVLQT